MHGRLHATVLTVWMLAVVPLTACDTGGSQTTNSVPRFEAREIRRFDAREAIQGVAVDDGHFYAIMNSAIGKYDKRRGKRLAGWRDDTGKLQHLNSCHARDGRLFCAHSNYSDLPMASGIEIFDTATMQHVESKSLGLTDGSLTWHESHDGYLWAGFAHYDGHGGEPGVDHRYTYVAKFSDDWEQRGRWALPDSVLERLAPYSTSGGAFGPDGLLYLTGHDRKEMYVMRLDDADSKLQHLATIDIDVEGQAFAWDRSSDERVVYAISRPNREVRAFEIPAIREALLP